MDYIEKAWFQLVEPYSGSAGNVEKWFGRIKGEQNAPHRYYHTLNHVEQLLRLIDEHSSECYSCDALRFAAFFHDHIYVPGSSSNERLSAEVAAKAMNELSVPNAIIERTTQLILATRTHEVSLEDNGKDALLFIDMDMAILGSAETEYDAYRKGVEMEFSFTPRFLYNRGRARFLRTTLKRPFIFQTDVFRRRFELQARENLLRELDFLG